MSHTIPPLYVCFALQEENENFPAIPRAELTVASIRKWLPHAKIVQLSNLDFPEVEGVDEVLRVPFQGDFIEWGFGSVIKLMERGENVLQIETDILLNADVSPVFDYEFDVAACPYHLKDRTDGAFCGGVNFIKPSGLQFWKDALATYTHAYGGSLRDGWEGGQKAFLSVANASPHKVLALPFDEYCYTPEDFHEDITKAKIIHFRGNRKGMMSFYTQPMNLLKPFSAKIVANVPDGVLASNVRNALTRDIEILSNQYMASNERELIIVGGGPSLTHDLWEIALRQKGGAVIWALNNSFKYLTEHGIKPDAQVMLDARIENIEFVPEKTDALLLYSAQCHPDIISKAQKAGKVILWCPSITEILDLLNEAKKLAAVVQGGSSVGLKAIAVAHLFGFKEAHLYGYDSCYAYPDRNHAYDQPLNDYENILIATFNNVQYKCAYWMVSQVQEFQKSLPNFLKMGLNIYVHGYGLLPDVAKSILAM